MKTKPSIPSRTAPNSASSLNHSAWEKARGAYDAEFSNAKGVTYDGLRAGIVAYLDALPTYDLPGLIERMDGLLFQRCENIAAIYRNEGIKHCIALVREMMEEI